MAISFLFAIPHRQKTLLPIENKTNLANLYAFATTNSIKGYRKYYLKYSIE